MSDAATGAKVFAHPSLLLRRRGPTGAGPGRPSWRLSLLLQAIGSAAPDGSDVTASDRKILLGIDRHLAGYAAAHGEAAARRALVSVIRVLASDIERPELSEH